jgi:hypothetical protein
MKAMNRPMPTPMAFFSAGQHQHGDHQALEHDQAHRLGPGQALAGDEGEGDHAVDAEAGGQRERVVGVQAHQQGHGRGHQSGDGEQRARRQLAAAGVGHRSEDRRVEEEDVGHGHERGEAGDHLDAQGRSSCSITKELVEPPVGAATLLRLGCCSHGCSRNAGMGSGRNLAG